MNYHPPGPVDIKGTFGTIWYRFCLLSKKRKRDFSRKIKHKTKIIDKINVCNSTERRMRSFLINKNMSLYYWLKRRIGKTMAFRVANAIEKVILIFGRERMPHGKVGINKKVKQLRLILSIKKSILIWKLMNITHLLR
jgi:hypothetical protein